MEFENRVLKPIIRLFRDWGIDFYSLGIGETHYPIREGPASTSFETMRMGTIIKSQSRPIMIIQYTRIGLGDLSCQNRPTRVDVESIVKHVLASMAFMGVNLALITDFASTNVIHYDVLKSVEDQVLDILYSGTTYKKVDLDHHFLTLTSRVVTLRAIIATHFFNSVSSQTLKSLPRTDENVDIAELLESPSENPGKNKNFRNDSAEKMKQAMKELEIKLKIDEKDISRCDEEVVHRHFRFDESFQYYQNQSKIDYNVLQEGVGHICDVISLSTNDFIKCFKIDGKELERLNDLEMVCVKFYDINLLDRHKECLDSIGWNFNSIYTYQVINFAQQLCSKEAQCYEKITSFNEKNDDKIKAPKFLGSGSCMIESAGLYMYGGYYIE